MVELSEEHPRYGYRRIAALLRWEGWAVGKRQIQRLRRVAGLRVPASKPRMVRRGVSTGLPTKATHRGHVWTWDFIADATVRGGALRMLTILDEHTRECHVLRADRALRSEDVLKWLKKAIHEHGAPQYLRSDNGSEFIAKAVQRWLAHNQIKTIYIDPGSPWQNGFVESFHGRFRDECLNREQLGKGVLLFFLNPPPGPNSESTVSLVFTGPPRYPYYSGSQFQAVCAFPETVPTPPASAIALLR